MSAFDAAVQAAIAAEQAAELARTEGLHLQGSLVTTQNLFAEAELEISRLDGELLAARSTIEELKQLLAEYQNPPHGTLGWSQDDPRFALRRLYYRLENVSKMLAEVRSVIAGGQRPLVGLKSGASTADVPSLPPCDFTWHHEPEDDFTDPAAFRSGFDAVVARLPDGVRPVVCLMDWTFDPRSGRNPADWMPDRAQALAVDAYNWFGVTSTKWRSPVEMLAAPLAFARSVGLPLLVWETNCVEDPVDSTRKATWLRELFDVVEAERIEQLVFFDAVWKAQPGYGKFVLFSSPQAIAAVEEGLARPYFGG